MDALSRAGDCRIIQDSIINWLLSSDPSIKWQVQNKDGSWYSSNEAGADMIKKKQQLL